MYKKKLCLFLMLMMMISIWIPQSAVFAADTTLAVQAYNGAKASASNTISPIFKVVNTSSSPINLSDIKLRYYYTSDGSQAQSFWCDTAAITSSNTYTQITSNVTGSFVKLATSITNADSYLEIGFTSTVAQVPAGGSVIIQTRFAKSDWSNYNQANDYSFNATATQYVDWTKITGYIAGVLKYGVAPGASVPVVDSTISPTSVIFDKNVPADVPVVLTLNGNTFSDIYYGTTKLVSGTNYTLASNTVTISKTYLATLPDGSDVLTFKFSAGADATLNIIVKPIVVTTSLNTTVAKVTGKTADTITVSINYSGVTTPILGTNFSVGYDTSLLDVVDVSAGTLILNATDDFAYNNIVASKKINIFWCDESYGSRLISKDGNLINIKFKIKGTAAAVTPITIADSCVADANANEISNKTVDGSITITQ